MRLKGKEVKAYNITECPIYYFKYKINRDYLQYANEIALSTTYIQESIIIIPNKATRLSY